MRDRIKGKPAVYFRRHIAALVGDKRMRKFMQGKHDRNSDKTCNQK